jgi:hypothetical protein
VKERRVRMSVKIDMCRFAAIVLVLALAATGYAADTTVRGTIDLRNPQALEQLERANPEHFDKIRRMLETLREQPDLVEGDWLEVAFDARDVDLSRYLIKTSYPPKQLLRFTLDDVRYTMHVVRSDLTAEFVPAIWR